MKKTMLAVALAAALTPNFAFAEQGDWVVRLRAVNINPSEDSKLGRMTNDAWNGTGSDAFYLNEGAELEVKSNTIPELDISYYVTKNIALELILALGSKHDVNIHKNPAGPQALDGKFNLGEVNVLPPTLTAQWHFNPDQTFDPYIGAGINYTRFMDNGLKLAGAFPIRVERNSWGPALQAGFDINLKDGWMVNFDIKKVWIDTDVKMNLKDGNGYRKIDKLDIDPLVIGFGIGKRF
jgi:Outer membrane protein W